MTIIDLTQTGITIPMSEETEVSFVLDDDVFYKMTAGQIAKMFPPKGVAQMCIDLANLREENKKLKEYLDKEDKQFFSKVFPQGDDVVEDLPKGDSEREIEVTTDKNMDLISNFCDHLKTEEGIEIPEGAILSFFNA